MGYFEELQYNSKVICPISVKFGQFNLKINLMSNKSVLGNWTNSLKIICLESLHTFYNNFEDVI